MSVRNNTWSSCRCSGTFKGPMSANGTRANSAWPPAYPPRMCEYPKIPHGEYPHSFSTIHALGLEFSHSEYMSRSHCAQCPQAIGKGTTTRSPTARLWTPVPTSTISPMNSCPRMSPRFMVGMNPLYRCRSDPQMAVLVILTIASRGLRMVGSGTSSTLRVFVPYQQLAFMGVLLQGIGW